MFCRSVFAPASISAFTASVSPLLAAAIRAVTPFCPPQEERERHVTPSHTPLRPQHVEASNTAHAIPSTLQPPLTYAEVPMLIRCGGRCGMQMQEMTRWSHCMEVLEGVGFCNHCADTVSR